VTDKSAAVLPITRSPLTSEHAPTPARIAPSDFAEHLRRGREGQTRTLEEIADTTKISIQQLRALERGDLHRLPTGIYRRAIVRQYAEAAGLNVAETLRGLESVVGEGDGNRERLETVAHRRGDTSSFPSTTAVWSSAAAVVSVGVLATVAGTWYHADKKEPAAVAPVAIASAPTATSGAPADGFVAATGPVRADTAGIKLVAESAFSQTGTGGVAEEDATEGELRITSEPAGAQVTVNGIQWGQTPVTIRYLPYGKKVIRATKPGYGSVQRGFEFAPGGRVPSVRIRLSPDVPETR
jgi:cytoskeletal protein RodZ